MIQIYEIRKSDYEMLYNILLNDYLNSDIDYKTCVDKAFEFIDTIPEYIDNCFRLTNYIYRHECGACFFVDRNKRKIIYEGYINIRNLDYMKYSDYYIPADEIDNICEKYSLERKSDRRIKIEKMINKL
jgi:hypothetical protein